MSLRRAPSAATEAAVSLLQNTYIDFYSSQVLCCVPAESVAQRRLLEATMRKQ